MGKGGKGENPRERFQTQCNSKHALTRARQSCNTFRAGGGHLDRNETASEQGADAARASQANGKKGETRSSATSVPVAKGSRAAGRNKPGRRPRWPRQWNCSTAGLCPGADTGITSKTWNSIRSERSEVQRSRASLQHLASTAPRERRGKKKPGKDIQVFLYFEFIDLKPQSRVAFPNPKKETLSLLRRMRLDGFLTSLFLLLLIISTKQGSLQSVQVFYDRVTMDQDVDQSTRTDLHHTKI